MMSTSARKTRLVFTLVQSCFSRSTVTDNGRTPNMTGQRSRWFFHTIREITRCATIEAPFSMTRFDPIANTMDKGEFRSPEEQELREPFPAPPPRTRYRQIHVVSGDTDSVTVTAFGPEC